MPPPLGRASHTETLIPRRRWEEVSHNALALNRSGTHAKRLRKPPASTTPHMPARETRHEPRERRATHKWRFPTKGHDVISRLGRTFRWGRICQPPLRTSPPAHAQYKAFPCHNTCAIKGKEATWVSAVNKRYELARAPPRMHLPVAARTHTQGEADRLVVAGTKDGGCDRRARGMLVHNNQLIPQTGQDSPKSKGRRKLICKKNKMFLTLCAVLFGTVGTGRIQILHH